MIKGGPQASWSLRGTEGLMHSSKYAGGTGVGSSREDSNFHGSVDTGPKSPSGPQRRRAQIQLMGFEQDSQLRSTLVNFPFL